MIYDEEDIYSGDKVMSMVKASNLSLRCSNLATLNYKDNCWLF
jgi:hypothetical protein